MNTSVSIIDVSQNYPLDIHFRTHKETLHRLDQALFLENLVHSMIDLFGLSDADRHDRRTMKTSRVVSRISGVVSTFPLHFLFLFVVLIHSSFSYLGVTCGEGTWTWMDSMGQDATSTIHDWTTDEKPTTYPTTSSERPSLFPTWRHVLRLWTYASTFP
jgi:hypothetical protein